jgi:hypothetical protein
MYMYMYRYMYHLHLAMKQGPSDTCTNCKLTHVTYSLITLNRLAPYLDFEVLHFSIILIDERKEI